MLTVIKVIEAKDVTTRPTSSEEILGGELERAMVRVRRECRRRFRSSMSSSLLFVPRTPRVAGSRP